MKLSKCVGCVIYIVIVFWAFLTCADMVMRLIGASKNISEKLDDHVFVFDPDIKNFGSVVPHPLMQGKISPDILVIQERYNGEDARFTCSKRILGINTSKPHVNQVLWKKNGSYIKPSARYNISWVFEEYRDSKFIKFIDLKKPYRVFIVTSTLEIRLIGKHDYGVYNCYVSERTDFVVPDSYLTSKPRFDNNNKESTCQCHDTLSSVKRDLSMDDIEQIFFDWNQFVWQSEFRLIQDYARTEKIFAAPGTIISLAGYFRHLGNDEDISMHYTINNKNTTVFQSKCSTFVLMYYVLFNRSIIDTISFILLSRMKRINYFSRSGWKDWKAAFAVMNQCISPKSYGIHDIVITRTIRDTVRGINFTKQYSHPLKLDIRPKDPNLFHLDETDSSTSMFDVDCWTSKRDSNDSRCEILSALLDKIAHNVYFTDTILAFLVLASSCIVTKVFIDILHNVHSFVTPMFYRKKQVAAPESLSYNQVAESESLANIPVEQEKEIKYHIFVSYVGDDYAFIRNNILPILQSFGLKTFVRKHDIIPGCYKITEIGKAIMKSHSFIVIASSNYVKDDMRNTFEINTILNIAKPYNLLILKKNDCKISKLFKYYKLIDWNLESNSAAKLESWINETFPPWSPKPMSFIYVFICVFFLTICTWYYTDF